MAMQLGVVLVLAAGFMLSKITGMDTAAAMLAIRICFAIINVTNVIAHIWFYRCADRNDESLKVTLKTGRELKVAEHDKAAALMQLRTAISSIMIIVAMHIMAKTSKPLLIQAAIIPYRLLTSGLFKVYCLKQDGADLRPFPEMKEAKQAVRAPSPPEAIGAVPQKASKPQQKGNKQGSSKEKKTSKSMVSPKTVPNKKQNKVKKVS
jgi:hypothetical protein